MIIKRTWLVCGNVDKFWCLLFLWSIFFSTHRLCHNVLNNYFVWDWLWRDVVRKFASERFWNILLDHWYWLWALLFWVVVKVRNLSFCWGWFFCYQIFISYQFFLFWIFSLNFIKKWDWSSISFRIMFKGISFKCCQLLKIFIFKLILQKGFFLNIVFINLWN